MPNFLEGCVIGFCLISDYSDHPQPPVFRAAPRGWPSSVAVTGGQVREQIRQQAGGGHTAGTQGFRLLGQEVNFSICKDRRDPPKLYKKEMEKQQLNSRYRGLSQPRRLQALMLEFLWLRVMRLPLQKTVEKV